MSHQLSSYAVETIFTVFADYESEDDDSIMSWRGFASLISQAPGLLNLEFTLDEARSTYEKLTPPGISGLPFPAFVEALRHLAVQRYPAEEAGVAYAHLLAMHIFKVSVMNVGSSPPVVRSDSVRENYQAGQRLDIASPERRTLFSTSAQHPAPSSYAYMDAYSSSTATHVAVAPSHRASASTHAQHGQLHTHSQAAVTQAVTLPVPMSPLRPAPKPPGMGAPTVLPASTATATSTAVATAMAPTHPVAADNVRLRQLMSHIAASRKRRELVRAFHQWHRWLLATKLLDELTAAKQAHQAALDAHQTALSEVAQLHQAAAHAASTASGGEQQIHLLTLKIADLEGKLAEAAAAREQAQVALAAAEARAHEGETQRAELEEQKRAAFQQRDAAAAQLAAAEAAAVAAAAVRDAAVADAAELTDLQARRVMGEAEEAVRRAHEAEAQAIAKLRKAEEDAEQQLRLAKAEAERILEAARRTPAEEGPPAADQSNLLAAAKAEAAQCIALAEASAECASKDVVAAAAARDDAEERLRVALADAAASAEATRRREDELRGQVDEAAAKARAEAEDQFRQALLDKDQDSAEKERELEDLRKQLADAEAAAVAVEAAAAAKARAAAAELERAQDAAKQAATAAALAAAEGQQTVPSRIPMWMWLLVGLLCAVVAGLLLITQTQANPSSFQPSLECVQQPCECPQLPDIPPVPVSAQVHVEPVPLVPAFVAFEDLCSSPYGCGEAAI